MAIRSDVPDWILPLATPEWFAAMRCRAPLDLRVNSLKATADEARSALEADGVDVRDVHEVPGALRVTGGARRVRAGAAFREGLVEIQDAASQQVALFSHAFEGTVLDLCAGGGGKTLALGALMAGRGRLIAHDISEARMADLPDRAERSGVDVELRKPAELRDLAGGCDSVIVDAPCSGSGAWRRNPDAKWRLDPTTLAELEAVQGDLLDQAEILCAPTGQIVYMTCSIFERENQAQVHRFLAHAPGFELADQIALSVGAPGDGFFAARLQRTSGR